MLLLGFAPMLAALPLPLVVRALAVAGSWTSCYCDLHSRQRRSYTVCARGAGFAGMQHAAAVICTRASGAPNTTVLVPVVAGDGCVRARGAASFGRRAMICNQTVEFARIGGGVAIVICNQRVQFPLVGGGIAIGSCMACSSRAFKMALLSGLAV